MLAHRLTICGLNEIPRFAGASVSHVLSILDPDWPEPEAFQDFPPHARETMRFDDVVEISDFYAAPEAGHIDDILAFGRRLQDQAVTHLLIHCHAGVSRSTAAAAILMAASHPGRESDAFRVIAEIRPRSWPNSRMIALGDAVLARGGAFTAALKAHHRWVTQQHPDLAELIRLHGRAHEVPELMGE